MTLAYKQIVLALAVGMLLPSVSLACAFGPEPLFNIDKRISVDADGSFENAAEGDTVESLVGLPVVNVSNGRVGQRIVATTPCASTESLLVVDCSTLEMIKVEGILPDGPSSSLYFASIANIQHPLGSIRADRMTIGEIAATAKASEYQFTVDVRGEVAEMRKRNRYDPFYGCKIFYPDSAGANM